jgi:hypothetical protein
LKNAGPRQRLENNITMKFKGIGYEDANQVGSFEYGNKPSGSIKHKTLVFYITYLIVSTHLSPLANSSRYLDCTWSNGKTDAAYLTATNLAIGSFDSTWLASKACIMIRR